MPRLLQPRNYCQQERPALLPGGPSAPGAQTVNTQPRELGFRVLRGGPGHCKHQAGRESPTCRHQLTPASGEREHIIPGPKAREVGERGDHCFQKEKAMPHSGFSKWAFSLSLQSRVTNLTCQSHGERRGGGMRERWGPGAGGRRKMMEGSNLENHGNSSGIPHRAGPGSA